MVTRKNPNRLKKRLMSVYAHPKQEKALRRLSRKTKVPMQAYLRKGLDWILENPNEVLR